MRCLKRTSLILAVAIFLSVLNMQAPLAQTAVEGYILSASTGELELYCHENKGSIAVRDKRSGMVWYSTPSSDVISADSLTEPLRNELDSLFVLSYTEMNQNNTQVKTEPVMSLKPDITSENLNNGIRLSYFIKKLNLQISVDAVLDSDTLIVSIPSDGILEGVGSKEAVTTRMQPIRDFISEIEAAINELKADKSLKNINRDIKKLSDIIRSLSGKADSIQDAVGIEAFSDDTLELLNEIQTLYAGGSGIEGLFTKIGKLENLDDSTKQKYRDISRSLDDKIMMAKVAASALKTIKVGSVIELSLMPNFGAGADHEEGYAVYPDGSGAVSYFREDHQVYTNYFKRYVYSNDDINIDWEKEMDKSGIKRTMLPVFGISKNCNAYVAAITDGDTESTVNYYPSGYVLELYRVFAGFRYRRTVETQSRKGEWTGGATAMMYEKEKLDISPEVRYMFLSGDNADYSGMASRYREYLLKNNKIKKSPVLDKGMPLGLELFGGVKQKRVLFERYIKMTSFSDAENILGYLNENNVGTILLNLYGWTEEGYGKYPSKSKPAGKLGGEKGLRALSAAATSLGVYLFLQDNYIESHLGTSGYRNKDLALNNSQRIIRSLNGRIMLASPLVVLARFINLVLPIKSKYDISGITFDSIGRFLYFDYNKDRSVQRTETAGTWQQLLQKSQESFGSAAVRGGNGYVLGSTDWLLEIPTGSTKYLFTDAEIPFYQMVVHGLIPYASKPFNQFYDHRYEKLKAIEYGCIPYYILTWEDTSLLKNTDYDTLFSTKFEDWKENIVSVYEEFNSRLGKTADQYITKHIARPDGITEVRYADGTRVLINYSDSDIDADGYEIKALDYAIIE